jgi:hypothetical protein
MKQKPSTENCWRARRVLKGVMLTYPVDSEGWRYYEAIFYGTLYYCLTHE